MKSYTKEVFYYKILFQRGHRMSRVISKKNLFFCLITTVCQNVLPYFTYSEITTISAPAWPTDTTVTVCEPVTFFDSFFYTPSWYRVRPHYVQPIIVPQVKVTIPEPEPVEVETYMARVHITTQDQNNGAQILRKTLSAGTIDELIESTQDYVITTCQNNPKAEISIECKMRTADSNNVISLGKTNPIVWGRHKSRMRPFKTNEQYVSHKIEKTIENAFAQPEEKSQQSSPWIDVLAAGLLVTAAILAPEPEPQYVCVTPVYRRKRHLLWLE
jgi:hypothetical protein